MHSFKVAMGKAYSATKEQTGKVGTSVMHSAKKHAIQSDVIHGQFGDLKLPPRKLDEDIFTAFAGGSDLKNDYAFIVEQCENARYLGNVAKLKSPQFEEAYQRLTAKTFTASGGGDVANNVKEFKAHAQKIASRKERNLEEIKSNHQSGFLSSDGTTKLFEEQRRAYQAAGREVPERLAQQVAEYRQTWAGHLDAAARVGRHKHSLKRITEQINGADTGDVREAISHFNGLTRLNPTLAKHYLQALQTAVQGLANRTRSSIQQIEADQQFGVHLASKPLLKADIEANIKQIEHAETAAVQLIDPGVATQLTAALQEIHLNDENPFI